MTFEKLFERATGSRPYPYQIRWATGDGLPSVVSVPTGLGKTAGAILSWIWRRRFASEETRTATPSRLVYCLPMRVLVEQTRDMAVEWLGRLDRLAADAPQLHPADKVAVHVLMGGDLERDWDYWPDRDQVLIGTQDMLLSRALNRGYAMSRFRWPLQFGLLNNDCQWIMDEVQLMGSGLATTAQLQAFRRTLGSAIPVHSTWMSATLRQDWFSTVDFDPDEDAPGFLALDESDRSQEVVSQRYTASKPIARTDFEASGDGKAEAEWLCRQHEPGTRSMLVVNTVRRAQAIYAAIEKSKPRAQTVLIHSRFRPGDRQRALARLLQAPGGEGTICVSTQVVEAGVDVSVRLLGTDLAPWSAMVQRFGRCNRRGEMGNARVAWIPPADLDNEKKLKAAPYQPAELRDAADKLRGLVDVGLQSLPEVDERLAFHRVLRRKDMVELFDTTPDLAGADIDVSRFIRETSDHDLRVFWRDVKERVPSQEEPAPARDELCAIPVGEVDPGKRVCWRWDHLERQWVKATTVFPGLVLMLRSSEGGYDERLGWYAKAKTTAPLVFASERTEDANDTDTLSVARCWQSVAEHTERVMGALNSLLATFPEINSEHRHALLTAARWHDCGKAHPIFQEALAKDRPLGVWAKSLGKMSRYARPGFRHELASALAMLRHGLPDLAAYLAAAHHGKVRLSIRSLPHEKTNENRFARGIWENDTLPEVDLGGETRMPETALTLSYMELGDDEETGPSWLARMLALRNAPDLGPFRLALFESMLRVADWRGSADTEVK